MIYLIYRGKFRNYGLQYEYTVPRKEAWSRPEYKWTFSDWSPCSATCGGGTQSSQPVCHEKGVRFVNTSLCLADQRPSLLMRACNDHPCPARWWTGPWQICSATCGEGARCKRTVLCSLLRKDSGSAGRELALPDKECESLEKPAEFQLCPNLPSCSPVVATSFQTTPPPPPPVATTASPPRQLPDDDEQELAAYNYTVEEPATAHFSDVGPLSGTVQLARTTTSDGWEAGTWGACSVTCGEGRKTRKVTCVAWDGVCNTRSKPAEVEVCLGHAQRSHQWVTGPWSQCSVSCQQSVGYHRRRVDCIQMPSGRLLRAECCSHAAQPAASEPCRPRYLCRPDHDEVDCTDKLPSSVCSSFIHLCNDSPYIHMKCCHSCSRR